MTISSITESVNPATAAIDTLSTRMIVAAIQTVWVRTGHDKYLQLTKFFGKLFLINFALGVVTDAAGLAPDDRCVAAVVGDARIAAGDRGGRALASVARDRPVAHRDAVGDRDAEVVRVVEEPQCGRADAGRSAGAGTWRHWIGRFLDHQALDP